MYSSDRAAQPAIPADAARGDKIVAFLKLGIEPKVVSIYPGGAADAQGVRRQPITLLPVSESVSAILKWNNFLLHSTGVSNDQVTY
jgi:hypothetical protein